MYFYIFDSYCEQPKYAKQTDLIKLKLADLEIITDKVKATPIRQVEILTREAIAEKKYKNIIAVGNDRTAHLIINEIVKSKENITFGLIPLGPSRMAELCGMPQGVEACETISARKIEKVDIGKLDYLFFLTALEVYSESPEEKNSWQKFFDKFIKPQSADIEIDFKNEEDLTNKFKISAKIEKVVIANLLPEKTKEEIEKLIKTKYDVSPYDGLLNIFVFTRQKKKEKSISVFRAKRLHLKCKKSLLCFVDGQKTRHFSSYVGVKPQALNIIVGKNREF